MAARSISPIFERLRHEHCRLIGQADPLQIAFGVEAGRCRFSESLEELRPLFRSASGDEIADVLRFVLVEYDQIGAARRHRLRRGRLCFLVPDLPVNDRRVSALGVPPDVLPHVEHGSAGGVDERASCAIELLQHAHGDAERRQDHDVSGAELVDLDRVLIEKPHAHASQLLVDVRVVDDFAGQKHLAIRNALASLVGVVDGSIHAVTEAELTRQVYGQPSGAEGEVLRFDPFDDGAVVVLGEPAGDGLLEVESLAEDQRSQRSAGEIADVDDLTHVRSERIEDHEFARVRAVERRFQIRHERIVGG